MWGRDRKSGAGQYHQRTLSNCLLYPTLYNWKMSAETFSELETRLEKMTKSPVGSFGFITCTGDRGKSSVSPFTLSFTLIDLAYTRFSAFPYRSSEIVRPVSLIHASLIRRDRVARGKRSNCGIKCWDVGFSVTESHRKRAACTSYRNEEKVVLQRSSLANDKRLEGRSSFVRS